MSDNEKDMSKDDLLDQEAIRQKMGEIKNSLSERDRGLKALQEEQQFLEDQLEDANTDIDRLRRELDKAQLEADEARFLLKESEEACRQLESSVHNFKSGVEDTRVSDLRDDRLSRTPKSWSFSSVTLVPFIKGLVLGTLLTLLFYTVILESALLSRGRGELFDLVFG